MKSPIGVRVVRYSEESVESWNFYIKQVTEIALSHPNHFLARTAREIIPLDAKRHRLYVYLDNDGVVLSFAVIVLSADQAEILWMATHPKYLKGGLATSLLTSIEDDLFQKSSDIILIKVLCCAEDTSFQEDYEVITGANWFQTHAFYRSNQYVLEYKLEHYWTEGSHALVFTKRKGLERYGYTKNTTNSPSCTPPRIETDNYPDVNRLIFDHVWSCLDVFDEKFVAGFSSTTGTTTKEVTGITGIVFADANEELATIFAQKSYEPVNYSPSMRFEFDLRSSMITKELFESEDEEGVFFYPKSWDELSEIKLSAYFKKYFKGYSNNKDFSVFFSKRKGKNDHYTILYFITPEVQRNNVVWFTPIWRSLSYYSFALILELYSFFSSLTIVRKELTNIKYFEGLMHAVSPIKSPGNFGKRDIAKIIKIRRRIQQRVDQYHKEIIRSKESAIVHYGHTLGHRLSPIQAYFDGNIDSKHRAFANAKFLDSLSVVLQAMNIANSKELFNHPKKRRFLLYEQENDPLILEDKIKNEWSLLAESSQPVYISSLSSLVKIMVSINFTGEIKGAYLDYMLHDPVEQANSRLQESFYSQLFSELLLNIVRYSGIASNRISVTDRTAKVTTALSFHQISHHLEHISNPCSVITLSNKVGEKPPPSWLNNSQWSLWPDNRDNDGPGMAIAVLRRLGVGELWYRYNPVNKVFRVAVYLKGLKHN